MISPHKNDAILIPVNYDYSAAAFDIEKSIATNRQTILSNINIVSVLNLKHSKQLRKAQQFAKLKDELTLSNHKLYKTNADLIKGMSGSPAFNTKGEIIGMISRGTKFNVLDIAAPINRSTYIKFNPPHLTKYGVLCQRRLSTAEVYMSVRNIHMSPQPPLLCQIVYNL